MENPHLSDDDLERAVVDPDEAKEPQTNTQTGWENLQAPPPPDEEVEQSEEDIIDMSDELFIFDAVKAKDLLDDMSQRNGGKVVIAKFYDETLRSDMTEDEIFLAIFGQTKADFDKAEEEALRQYEEEKKRALAESERKMPERIEAGKRLIYKARFKEWEKWVERHTHSVYRGDDIDTVLEIMQLLEEGASLKEASAPLAASSGAGEDMVRRAVFHFSKQGPDFYRASRAEESKYFPLTRSERISIAKQKLANAFLELRELGIK